MSGQRARGTGAHCGSTRQRTRVCWVCVGRVVWCVCATEGGAPTGARTHARALTLCMRDARQSGNTALICASKLGHLEVVNALLGDGADKEAKNKVLWV